MYNLKTRSEKSVENLKQHRNPIQNRRCEKCACCECDGDESGTHPGQKADKESNQMRNPQKKLDSSPKIRTDQITIRQNSEQVANNALAQTGRTAKICQTIIQFKIRLGVVNVYLYIAKRLKK